MPQLEHIGDASLYRGDCLEVLPTLSNVRCLITDPPYRVTSGGRTNPGFGGWMKHSYDNSGAIVSCDLTWSDWLPLVPATLTPGAHAYIFSNDRNLPAAWTAAETAGLRFHRLLTWHKRTAMPNRWYMQNCEFVLFLRHGPAYAVKDCGVMAMQTVAQRDESDHPTEKPVGLLELYVRQSSDFADLVLDPFLGSGSTGVAAIKQGRRFVGIEIDQRWFDVACRRIDRAEKYSRRLGSLEHGATSTRPE